MKVCDICRKKISYPVKIKAENMLFGISYETCEKCAKKINKYIRFEQKKNKRKDERK